MSRVRAFGLFWWDFIVGDDYRVAVGVVIVLGLSAVLSHRGVTTWWVPLVAVPTVLAASVIIAARTALRARGGASAGDA
ncbi:MAG: hypothetical protein NVSMB29_01230 [Candidatus Dormibacteria bacterium]